MTTAPVNATATGGREATARRIAPKLALAVGDPEKPAPNGWQWMPLAAIARMESGHTPSRRHPEYWDGDIPWIGLQDARNHHGCRIADTLQHTNELGIRNSSARILPPNTVCLSRTASVGYVVVTDRPMATSQDFVNWICSDRLDPDFLQYLFISEGRDILRFASGSVHQTIYFPEAKSFYVCVPSMRVQRRIVGILDEAFEGIAAAKANAEKNLQNVKGLAEAVNESLFDQSSDINFAAQPLAALCEFIVDCEHKTAPTQAEGIPSIRTPNIGKGKLHLEGVNRVSAATYREWTRRGEPLPGDLILAREAPAGNVAVVPEGMKVCLGQRTVLIRPKRNVFEPAYLVHLLLQRNSQRRLLAHSRGATVQHVNMKDIRAFEIRSVPSLQVQHKFIARLDDIDQQCEIAMNSYQRKLAALDKLKKSLLHQAFTGAL